MTMVEPFHELLKVISGKIFAEATGLSDQIEEAAALSEFEDDIPHILWLLFGIHFCVYCLSRRILLNDVLVVE